MGAVQLYRDLVPDPERSSICQLLELIEVLWTSPKYRKMAREAMARYGTILQDVVDRDGAHK